MQNVRRNRPDFVVEPLDRRAMLSASKALVAPPRLAAAATLRAPTVNATLPARQVENLDRGLVALNRGNGTVYLSWRLLGLDPSNVAFNVYRSVNGAAATKLNASPITATTDYTSAGNNFVATNVYSVRPVVNGVEGPVGGTFTLAANSATQQFQRVPLQKPADGVTPTGEAYAYSPNDASVGDLDGDGQYELIVKWDPSNSKDNSQSGYTGNVYVDAYRLDGTRLWRVDLGRNIRAGAHYTQFIVYDLDGDGKAEVAMKTAPGTLDGLGNAVLRGTDSVTADYRNTSGYILTGPEYLTVFNGTDGANRSTIAYNPPRGTVSSWGDSYGNRVDRFLATTAYLDGVKPSLIMARGYYTRSVLVAYDLTPTGLVQRWIFDSNVSGTQYRGQGAHSVTVGDVDNDGKDEIVYGAMTIDDNGSPLYTTGLGHGDALHLSDFDPSRPGLEVFQVHEDANAHAGKGGTFRDAATGAVLSFVPGTGDVGRGVAFDIDPRYPGAEMWTTGDDGIYNVNGTKLQGRNSAFVNFGLLWDADPLYELLDGTTIADWRITNGTGGRTNLVFAPANVASNNTTKATPMLSGDLFGDWREEVIWREADGTGLQIWSTATIAATRMVTLMHDVQYREAIAWQNVGYNQPPHTSFFFGDAMTPFAAPNVYYAGVPTTPPPTTPGVYQAEAAAIAGGVTLDSNNAGFNGTAFANFPTTGGSVTWTLVEGGAGGVATIGFRYSLGNTPRTGRLVVNGVAQDITFATTANFTTWAVVNVSVPLTAGATNTIQLLSSGQDLANVDELQVAAPTAAPKVTALVVNDGAAQRSRVTSLTLAFDQPVSVDPAGVTLARRGGGGAAPTLVLTPAADGKSVVVTFAAGPGTAAAGSLADGLYDLAVTVGAVRNSAGQALAAAYAATLHRLFGDRDGDGTVAVAELGALATAYGATRGTSAYDALFDVDDDGLIGVADLGAFATNYGVRITDA